MADALLPEPPFNVDATILSQYANSPTIVLLCETMQAWLDPSASIQSFFDTIWDVDTARSYGLDVWGRIVGVGRVYQIPATSYLGFAEAADTSVEAPFNQAPLFGGNQATSNFRLEDEAYRLLILAKAAANLSNGSAPAINAIMLALFPGRGNAYVTDGGDMTMAYTFAFATPLSPSELAIVSQSGVLPRPAGVSAAVVII